MRELDIVEKLVLGIDPAGRNAPLDTPKDALLDKARAQYYEQLKRVARQHAGPQAAPDPVPAPHTPRQGQRWTISEDNRLASLWQTSTDTATRLADKLERSPVAVLARLVKLGFFADLPAAMQADNHRSEAQGLAASWDPAALAAERPAPARTGTRRFGEPWRRDEDRQLAERWNGEGRPTARALAEQFGRSEGAILARLVRLGLYADRDAARDADRQRGGNPAGEP